MMLAFFFLQWGMPPQKESIDISISGWSTCGQRSKASPLCALETAWLDGPWTKGLAEGKTSSIYLSIYILYIYYKHL
jgi:hypothetical protein